MYTTLIPNLSLGLVIPCYNEEYRLLSSEFIEFYNQNPNVYYCFVNDGSTDGTSSLLEALKKGRESHFYIITLQTNSGKAEAVRRGMIHFFQMKGLDLVGFMDADLATPLSELKNFIQQFIFFPEVDVFCGSRIVKLGSNIQRIWYRHYLGRIFATLSDFIFRINVYDPVCGAKFFKPITITPVFEKPFKSRWLFDLEIFIRLLHHYSKEKFFKKIMEIPLNNWSDKKNSKVSFFTMVGFLLTLIKLRNYYGKS